MSDDYHGYNVSTGYTSYFFREMAPDWLDFCARAHGFDAQRAGPNYRYLDLGCGQGFHLCVLAAANPEARFVGIDFQPEHIAHATKLASSAGLANVSFVQADFLDLARAWPPEFGTFDYIALQGILSWISNELRAAVFDCVAAASKPGTLAAFGYNSQPGWLNAVPFQHVASKLSTNDAPNQALDTAFDMFRRLSARKAPFPEEFPGFGERLDYLSRQPSNYLVHEFLTDHWTSFWHSAVAEELKRADLYFVGSASVADALLPGALPAELRAVIEGQSDEAFRQDVQDIAINQSFRRDIFGPNPRPSDDESGLDSDAAIYLFSMPEEGVPLTFRSAWAETSIEYDAVADLVVALANGPLRVADLLALQNPLRQDTRDILLRMIDAQFLIVGKRDSDDIGIAKRFNAVIAKAVAGGTPYAYLAAAAAGTGVPATELELLLLDSWLSGEGQTETALVHGVKRRLEKLGRRLSNRGTRIDEEELGWHIGQLAQVFMDDVVPRWRILGVIE